MSEHIKAGKAGMETRYYDSIDGLRALSCLGIIMMHI